MAKAKSNSIAGSYTKKARIKRPGVHAKTKTSKKKTPRNYRKAYVGQG